MKIRTALLAASLTTGLALTSVPTAQAETWRHADAVGDVVVEPDSRTTEPSIAYGDLKQVTARYDEDGLQVATSARKVGCSAYVEVRVITSRGDSFTLAHGVASSEGCAFSHMEVRRNSYKFTCKGTRIVPNGGGYVARIPRSCLGSPYRVRVGVLMNGEYGNELDGGQTFDDVQRNGRYTSPKPKLSPWIVAG